MEKNDNEKIEKYKCLYKSENFINKNNKYIHSSKFIPNNSFLIFKDKNILKYNYCYNSILNSFDSIQFENEFIEKNYIYDYDIIYDENEENLNICICSKDNPIRILNRNLSLIKSFSLENKQKDMFLSSIFIKYEPFGLNLFTGKNYLCKIDLIKQRELFTIYNKNYNYLSCFDYNIKNSCYFLGSYSNKILMCDYKTDKIIEIFNQEKPVNQIKILNSQNYNIIVGYRNCDYISLFDIRKMNNYLSRLKRNAMTTKKINFILDNKEKNLYSGSVDGKLIRYSIFDKIRDKELNFEENNINKINYDIINDEIDIGIINCISSIDLNNDLNLMLITNGEKNNDYISYIRQDDDSDIISESQNICYESQFFIFKINEGH